MMSLSTQRVLSLCATSCILLSVFIALASAGSRIKFFDKSKKSVFTTDSAPNCTELPVNSLPLTNATFVQTQKCIMVYTSPGCSDFSRRITLSKKPVRIVIGKLGKVLSAQGVTSFQECNATEGGPILNVEIYEKESLQGEIVARFQNLTGCVNLEDTLVDKRMSANNHGHRMAVHTEKDCKSRGKLIAAGRNNDSDKLSEFDEYKGNFTLVPIFLNIMSISDGSVGSWGV